MPGEAIEKLHRRDQGRLEANSNDVGMIAGGGHYPGAAGAEAFDRGTAQALCTAADDDGLTCELGLDAHAVISSIVMMSLSSVKS